MATALYTDSSQGKYDNQIDLDQLRLNNCRIQCSFCQESQPSTEILRHHLMSCGNKTDECPKCRKYIRRAVFAYHYENNCANLDDADTPTPRSRNSSAHHNSNRPAVGEDNVNSRPKKSEKKTSPDTIKCQFCNHLFMPVDHTVHQENCLKNPSNSNKKPQQTLLESDQTRVRPSVNERSTSRDVVRIPCEYCNEQIDLRTWSTHTQDCREQELRRIEARAESINREPVIEKLPCEYCEELFSVERFETHEIICPKNPERIAREAKRANTQPVSAVTLSNTSGKAYRDPTMLSSYSSLPSSSMSAYNFSPQVRNIIDRTDDRRWSSTSQNERLSSNTNLESRRAFEVVRLGYNDTSSLAIDGRHPSKERRTSRDNGSQLINSSYDVSAYGSLLGSTTDRHLSHTQSLPHKPRSASLDRHRVDDRSKQQRPGSPSIPSSRPRSTSRDIRNDRGGLKPSGSKANKYLPVENNLAFYSSRDEDTIHQPKLKQRDRPTTINKKLGWPPPLQQPPMKF